MLKSTIMLWTPNKFPGLCEYAYYLAFFMKISISNGLSQTDSQEVKLYKSKPEW